MTVEEEFAAALLSRLPVALAFMLPDGRIIQANGGVPPRATIVFRNNVAFRSLLAAPSLLAFGKAFIAAAIDIEGDLITALEAAYAADDFIGVERTIPTSRPSDADAVRHHYDLPAEFYAQFLDRRLVYTCAYYRRPDDDLDDAQAAKLDLVCRKLDLASGDRFLDLGCGWGALTAWAAGRHGTDATGVTLSKPQAEWAARMLRDAGLDRRARIRHRHYQDFDDEAAFDKIAAVGLIEHVGIANYPAYFAGVHRLLKPGGLFLNHGITHAAPGKHSTGMTFLTEHVFPGAEFERVSHVTARMEDAGFRILDVEALGGHYALTTAAWLARLQANAVTARAIVGERLYRTWLAYLAAASVAFRAGWIDLHQVLAHRPGAPERAPLLRRDRWYRA